MSRGLKLKFSVAPELFMRFRDACQRMGTTQTDAVRMLVQTFTEMVESGELSILEVTDAVREHHAAELERRTAQ